MNAVDMVALFEGVHDDFPVAVKWLTDIHHRDHLIQVVGRQHVGDLVADPLRQRPGLRVRVDEDETGEGVHRNLDQRVLVLVNRTSQVLAQYAPQSAFQIVGPQVVLAEETTFGISGPAGTQHIAAMPAGIDEASKLLVLAARRSRRTGRRSGTPSSRRPWAGRPPCPRSARPASRSLPAHDPDIRARCSGPSRCACQKSLGRYRPVPTPCPPTRRVVSLMS